MQTSLKGGLINIDGSRMDSLSAMSTNQLECSKLTKDGQEFERGFDSSSNWLTIREKAISLKISSQKVLKSFFYQKMFFAMEMWYFPFLLNSLISKKQSTLSGLKFPLIPTPTTLFMLTSESLEYSLLILLNMYFWPLRKAVLACWWATVATGKEAMDSIFRSESSDSWVGVETVSIKNSCELEQLLSVWMRWWPQLAAQMSNWVSLLMILWILSLSSIITFNKKYNGLNMLEYNLGQL